MYKRTPIVVEILLNALISDNKQFINGLLFRYFFIFGFDCNIQTASDNTRTEEGKKSIPTNQQQQQQQPTVRPPVQYTL